jgi:hypothetical protein
VLNLFALIEEHGYGNRDPMNYVKEKEKMAGMVVDRIKGGGNVESI